MIRRRYSIKHLHDNFRKINNIINSMILKLKYPTEFQDSKKAFVLERSKIESLKIFLRNLQTRKFKNYCVGSMCTFGDHSPDDEENNDGRKQVISLIVQEIVDHPVAPLFQILEIR